MKAVGIASGRLDFLGGVADYSGSLVLEMPLSLTTRVGIAARAEPGFAFTSAQLGNHLVRRKSAAAELPGWVRYPYGCLLYFSSATGWRPKTGLTFAVDSTVPLGMGVSSSAAIEVATLRALENFSGRRLKPVALAHLAQAVENKFVGAPCGLMDQLTSACGTRGALLPILCRPDILRKSVRFPAGVIAVGWPSGVKHAVSASPYATARAAAFMGKRIIEQATGRRLKYVSEVTPAELAALPAEALPRAIAGREFVRRWKQVDDPLSAIVPGRKYPVRAATSFPIEENARAAQAVTLLRGHAARFERCKALGELLYASHAGYSAMGLGCPETDEMVTAIRALGPKKGFYGARVSGGGSGGTVVVLLEKKSLAKLETLMRRLRFRKDFEPQLLF
jgi:L-arabinokinase